ncbi:MAG: hypothetical protein Q8Q85_08375 [Gemmatimonadales bacterium]|nr:hypothetical protein [Gemmatimonadales bacterium]
MYRHRFLIAGVCSLLWCWPATAAAQGSTRACGELSHAELDLEALAHLFFEDEFAWFRDDIGIAQLDPAAPRSVVTDPRTCRVVVRAVRNALRDIYDHAPPLNSFDYAIFQYGPYYAVLLQSKPVEGVQIAGYSDLLIFRAATLEYLGSILV